MNFTCLAIHNVKEVEQTVASYPKAGDTGPFTVDTIMVTAEDGSIIEIKLYKGV